MRRQQNAAWPKARSALLKVVTNASKTKNSDSTLGMLSQIPGDTMRPLVDALIVQEASNRAGPSIAPKSTNSPPRSHRSSPGPRATCSAQCSRCSSPTIRLLRGQAVSEDLLLPDDVVALAKRVIDENVVADMQQRLLHQRCYAPGP